MDELTKRLVDAGLQVPVSGGDGGSNEPMVPIMRGDQQELVPASVGTYMALANIQGMLGQMMIRLDSLHHHLSFKAHAKSQENQTCPLCSAMIEAAQQAVENLLEGKDPEEETMVQE